MESISRVHRTFCALCQRPGRTAVLVLKAAPKDSQGRGAGEESAPPALELGGLCTELQSPPCPEVPLHLQRSVDSQDLLPLHIPAWNKKAFMRIFPHAPVTF